MDGEGSLESSDLTEHPFFGKEARSRDGLVAQRPVG
jgi:hypothetical protein